VYDVDSCSCICRSVFLVVGMVVSASMGGDGRAKQVIATLATRLWHRSVEARNEILIFARATSSAPFPGSIIGLLKLQIGRCCAACSHRPISVDSGRHALDVLLCFVVPAYVLYWRTGSVPLALLVGAFWASCRSPLRCSNAVTLRQFEKGLH